MAIKKMKDVGRKAITTKLSSQIGIYHDVASALDPRVGEPADETNRQKIFAKIEFIHKRIKGSTHEDETRRYPDQFDNSLSFDEEDSEEV